MPCPGWSGLTPSRRVLGRSSRLIGVGLRQPARGRDDRRDLQRVRLIRAAPGTPSLLSRWSSRRRGRAGRRGRGYRGARVSGFRSPRAQLTGSGPAEASATIVRRVLAELGVEDECCCGTWRRRIPGARPRTGGRREPARGRVPFLDELTCGRVPIAVGRLAAAALDAPYVRHPSHGGAAAFEQGSRRLPTIGRRRAPVRLFYEDLQRQAGRDYARVVFVDAEGKTLGRLATQNADTFAESGSRSSRRTSTPAIRGRRERREDRRDRNELDQKRYYRHSGYPGGL